jgi:hypothetical protein
MNRTLPPNLWVYILPVIPEQGFAKHIGWAGRGKSEKSIGKSEQSFRNLCQITEE